MQSFLTICWIGVVIIYGIVQLYAGFVGLDEAFGGVWAVIAIIAAFAFRFTLPLMVGSFLCATSVWDWHWFWALVFAAPSLLIMIPAIFAGIFDELSKQHGY